MPTPKVDKSVLIGIQKRYIAEMERKEGGPFLPKPPQKSSGKKVTIIGAGPAGLSAAYYLRLQGHEVTMYERHPKHGGMLRYGIPYYRLPEDVMDLEGDAIINQLGVTIHYNTEVGKSIGFEEIVQNSDAVLLAVGASKATPMGIEGEDLPGVFSGIDLLEKLAKYEPVDIGKRVVVAGVEVRRWTPPGLQYDWAPKQRWFIEERKMRCPLIMQKFGMLMMKRWT